MHIILTGTKKAKGIKNNYEFCRARAPLAFGSDKQQESSPHFSAERWRASKTLPLAGARLKTSFSVTVEWQACRRQAARQNLMGQLYSLVDQIQP